jgi:hypothetical protein
MLDSLAWKHGHSLDWLYWYAKENIYEARLVQEIALPIHLRLPRGSK